eukprot:gene11267-biopygen2137
MLLNAHPIPHRLPHFLDAGPGQHVQRGNQRDGAVREHVDRPPADQLDAARRNRIGGHGRTSELRSFKESGRINAENPTPIAMLSVSAVDVSDKDVVPAPPRGQESGRVTFYAAGWGLPMARARWKRALREMGTPFRTRRCQHTPPVEPVALPGGNGTLATLPKDSPRCVHPVARDNTYNCRRPCDTATVSAVAGKQTMTIAFNQHSIGKRHANTVTPIRTVFNRVPEGARDIRDIDIAGSANRVTKRECLLERGWSKKETYMQLSYCLYICQGDEQRVLLDLVLLDLVLRVLKRRP